MNRDLPHLQHISEQFNEELRALRDHVLSMGGYVEQQVQSAIDSVLQGDSGLAEQVRRNDKEVNRLEMAIDEECIRLIAKRQPTAGDLRLVVALTKMVHDLERVGDEAKKVAKSAIAISELGGTTVGSAEVRIIGNHVCRMLRDALNAFTRLDVETAFTVIQEDEAVDSEYKTALRSLITCMMEDPRAIGATINIMWILRSLERIGDHARNICQYVYYTVHGRDVRHTPLEEIRRTNI